MYSEFKIDNTWVIGTLIAVDIDNKTFKIKVEEDDLEKVIEYKNEYIMKRKESEILSHNTNIEHKINEQVEVLNKDKWTIGTVISKKGKFYLILFNNNNKEEETIIHKDYIRALTNNSQMIKLYINQCKTISLEKFNIFTKKDNYISRMISKLKVVFTSDELICIFSSGNDLYIFSQNIDIILIKTMIEESFNHFTKIDTKQCNTIVNKKDIKLNQNICKEIEIEKSIYESEKSKLKGNNVKLDIKKSKNSKDELLITIKAKDYDTLNESINILNKEKKYITIPASIDDPFFNEHSQSNLFDYAKKFDIENISFFKYDDNRTTIGMLGNKNKIEYFITVINTFFESQRFKLEKLNELSQIKNEILNYTNK